MHSPSTGMIVLAYPGLVNLGLPLFKVCIFVLEGNTHIVTVIFFFFFYGLGLVFFPKQA